MMINEPYKVHMANNQNEDTIYILILYMLWFIKLLRDKHVFTSLCTSFVSMTVCMLFFECVCPGGTCVSAPSQDPGTFQNTGIRPHNKQPRQRDLSTIHSHVTCLDTTEGAWAHRHTHTRSITNTYIWKRTCHVNTGRWKIYLKECGPCAHKKMHSGRCVHTEIRYESAYRSERNSFDMIRMVAKNNGRQRMK